MATGILSPPHLNFATMEVDYGQNGISDDLLQRSHGQAAQHQDKAFEDRLSSFNGQNTFQVSDAYKLAMNGFVYYKCKDRGVVQCSRCKKITNNWKADYFSRLGCFHEAGCWFFQMPDVLCSEPIRTDQPKTFVSGMSENDHNSDVTMVYKTVAWEPLKKTCVVFDFVKDMMSYVRNPFGTCLKNSGSVVVPEKPPFDGTSSDDEMDLYSGKD